jgi:REP element-mobilizing transposase RayT
MADSRYKTNASCVYALKYHLVWSPKYRKKVLVGRIEARLRELLYEKAANMGVQIEALEITPDHVHIFVSADPTEAPQRLANQFKGWVPNPAARIFLVEIQITNIVEQVVLCRQCGTCFGRFCEKIHCKSENEAVI